MKHLTGNYERWFNRISIFTSIFYIQFCGCTLKPQNSTSIVIFILMLQKQDGEISDVMRMCIICPVYRHERVLYSVLSIKFLYKVTMPTTGPAYIIKFKNTFVFRTFFLCTPRCTTCAYQSTSKYFLCR